MKAMASQVLPMDVQTTVSTSDPPLIFLHTIQTIVRNHPAVAKNEDNVDDQTVLQGCQTINIKRHIDSPRHLQGFLIEPTIPFLQIPTYRVNDTHEA